MGEEDGTQEKETYKLTKDKIEYIKNLLKHILVFNVVVILLRLINPFTHTSMIPTSLGSIFPVILQLNK